MSTSNLAQEPSEKGKIAIRWTVRDDCPADFIACVDLTREKFRPISSAEFRQKAQQHNRGNSHLWWLIEPGPKSKKSLREDDLSIYDADSAIPRIFGVRGQGVR